MAITLAIFAAVQVAMPLWICAHVIAPDHTTVALSSFTSLQTQTGPGGTFGLAPATSPARRRLDPLQRRRQRRRAAGRHQPGGLQGGTLGSPAWTDCLTSHGIRVAATYQPTSRYWPLQWTETAIYLALTLALAGYCFRRLGRRRLS